MEEEKEREQRKGNRMLSDDVTNGARTVIGW